MSDTPLRKLIAKIEKSPGCKFPGGYVLVQSEWRELRETALQQETELQARVRDAQATTDRVTRAGRATLLKHRIDELRSLRNAIPKGATQDRVQRIIDKRAEELNATARKLEEDV